MRSTILWENTNLLVKNHISPSKISCGFVPVDIDVTPCANSKTKKEDVSRTCKGCGGYAPMTAYLGREGYLINCELRKGIDQEVIALYHAHKTKLGLGKSNIWRKTFRKVYLSFSCLYCIIPLTATLCSSI